jgi:hypothetical protein
VVNFKNEKWNDLRALYRSHQPPPFDWVQTTKRHQLYGCQKLAMLIGKHCMTTFKLIILPQKKHLHSTTIGHDCQRFIGLLVMLLTLWNIQIGYDKFEKNWLWHRLV